jgi:hypothetical protein
MEEEVEFLRYRVETVVRMFTIEIVCQERSQLRAELLARAWIWQVL